MTEMTELPWEADYRRTAERPATDGAPLPSAFGQPSREVVDLLPHLTPGMRVLDLGCGDGRLTLPLAATGCEVTALDHSTAAIAALVARATHGLDADQRSRIHPVVADVTTYSIVGAFDVVIAHGLLQFLPIGARDDVLTRVQQATVSGGWNVVTVFTNRLPPPPDLQKALVGLFREGELFERYADWDRIVETSYTLRDEHPGGIRHEHPVNKLVARRRVT
jgi:tellurite methyltransferase